MLGRFGFGGGGIRIADYLPALDLAGRLYEGSLRRLRCLVVYVEMLQSFYIHLLSFPIPTFIPHSSFSQ